MTLWVALVGGIGAAARFMVDGILTARLSRALPTATLLINVTGSFFLGLVTGWATGGAEHVRAVAGIGFLGGFTTFSTASVELVRVVRAGRLPAAVGLGLAMLLFSVAAALLGLSLGSALR